MLWSVIRINPLTYLSFLIYTSFTWFTKDKNWARLASKKWEKADGTKWKCPTVTLKIKYKKDRKSSWEIMFSDLTLECRIWGKCRNCLGISLGCVILRDQFVCIYSASFLYLIFKCGKTTQLKKQAKILFWKKRVSNYA